MGKPLTLAEIVEWISWLTWRKRLHRRWPQTTRGLADPNKDAGSWSPGFWLLSQLHPWLSLSFSFPSAATPGPRLLCRGRVNCDVVGFCFCTCGRRQKQLSLTNGLCVSRGNTGLLLRLTGNPDFYWPSQSTPGAGGRANYLPTLQPQFSEWKRLPEGI